MEKGLIVSEGITDGLSKEVIVNHLTV
jgi:hypothetical protein